MRRTIFACVAVVSLLVAGCTPVAEQTPTPSPMAPLMCTPEEGGEAVPCTQTEYDAMVARDKLYDEAEVVLREYRAEYDRVGRMGGPASEELLGFVTGDIRQRVQEDFSHGITLEGGESKVLWVRRLVGSSMAGSIVALESCIDTRSVTGIQHGKVLGPGRLALERHYFADTADGLKIAAGEGKEVESC